MSRLVLKRIEKACADLNSFPTSSSISDVQQALATFAPGSGLNCTDPAIYGKAIECKIFDGLIKVINPPKNHESHKDVDGIFTSENGGILQRALDLFFQLIKIRRALLHRDGQSNNSLFPLFPQFRDLLGNLKKMLERTAKPISLPYTTSNNKKTDSNNIEDDDGINAERKKATTNNEFILNETILIRIRASTHVLGALQRLEPRATGDLSGASDFDELLILESVHVLALKNIAFGLEALKSATISRNTHNDDNGNKMLTTTIVIFLNAAVQTLRTSFEFEICGRDRVVSKTRWEAVRKLVIHHNLVPFLFHASSVVDDQPAVLDDVPFRYSSLRVLVNCAKTNPTEEQLKKWNLPVSEVSIIGQRIVQGGFLRSLLRFAELDNIDKVPQRKDTYEGLCMLLVVCALLVAIDGEVYFYPFLEMDGVAILTKLMDHESIDVRNSTLSLISILCTHRPGEWNNRASTAELFISCGMIKKLSRIFTSKSYDTYLRSKAIFTLRRLVHFLRTDDFPEFDDEQEKTQQQERIAELRRMLVDQRLELAVVDAALVFITEDWIPMIEAKPFIGNQESSARDELSAHIFELANDLLEYTPKDQARMIFDTTKKKNGRYLCVGLGCFVRSVIKPQCLSAKNTTPGVERRRMFIRKYFPELVEDNSNTKTTDDEVKSDD